MTQETRDALRGALIGGALFGAVSAVQAGRAGVSLLAVIQPILVFSLIGLTVGGLAGPLVGRALRRRRES
jgi:hypothetical protein